jgi:hypothetical protein
MKRYLILVFIFWLNTPSSSAQFGPPQQIFDTGGNETYLFDIDGDNALDVLHITNDFVYWFKNLDGQGTFGTANQIASNIGLDELNRALYAGDLDGDNDLDIIFGTAGFSDRLAWCENLDGLGDFGSPTIIHTNEVFLTAAAADIDNDTDIDVISGASATNRISWFENLDGVGNFGSENVIANDADFSISITSTDIDGDGDIDILSSIEFDNEIAWYENLDGLGSFSSQRIITTNAIEASSVITADIDGDNDPDVISGAFQGANVAWYENLDGQGNFGSQRIITTNAIRTQKVSAADIDRDGDMDVLSASSFNSNGTAELKTAWYENLDGLGTFGPQQVIAIGIGGIFMDVGDIDGDGDMDLLTTGGEGVVWFENVTPLAVPSNTLNTIKLYPNPAKDTVTITSTVAVQNIRCIDAIGRHMVVPYKNKELDISALAAGSYVVQVETALGRFQQKLVKH